MWIREERCFERGVKGTILFKLEELSLNRAGLRHQLAATYNAALGSLPRKFHSLLHPSHNDQDDPSLNNAHQLTTNDSNQ